MRVSFILLTVIWGVGSLVVSEQARRAREIDRIALLQSESYQTMESTIYLLSSLQLPVICDSVTTDPEAAKATVADLLFFALDVVKSQEMMSDEATQTADEQITTSLPLIFTTVLGNHTKPELISQPQSESRISRDQYAKSSLPIPTPSELTYPRRLLDSSNKDYFVNSEFRRMNRQKGEKNDDYLYDNSIHNDGTELKEMPETQLRVHGRGNTANEVGSSSNGLNSSIPTLTGVLRGRSNVPAERGMLAGRHSVGIGSTVPSYWFPLHWVYRTQDRNPGIPYQSERKTNTEHDNSTNTSASEAEVSGDSRKVTPQWQGTNTKGRANTGGFPEAEQIEANSSVNVRRVKANVSDSDDDVPTAPGSSDTHIDDISRSKSLVATSEDGTSAFSSDHETSLQHAVKSKRPTFKTKHTNYYRDIALEREELSKNDDQISDLDNNKYGLNDDRKTGKSLNEKLEDTNSEEVKINQNKTTTYHTSLTKHTSVPLIKIGSETDFMTEIQLQHARRGPRPDVVSTGYPHKEYDISEEEYFHWNTLETDHDWQGTETEIDESADHVRARHSHHSERRRGDIPIEPREHSAAAQDGRWLEEEDMRCDSVFGFYEDPLNCQKFYICSWGLPYHFDCAPGTLWNANLTVCDWPRNVRCGSRPWFLKGTARRVPYKAV